MNYTESSIIKQLRLYFAERQYTYRIENVFLFHEWESDFFCINRKGCSFEFEVKVTRSDFFADMKKRRHRLLNGESVVVARLDGVDKTITKADIKLLPNRLYYVVPHGLVSVDEIPSYAGLIYCAPWVTIMKRAPYIHKQIDDYSRLLCDKFYHRWNAAKREQIPLGHLEIV